MNVSCASALDWDDLRFFAALARHGTLVAAARALAVPQAGVSQRLARLEARLGAPLFAHEARRLELTSIGASVLAEAAQMEMAACAISQMCTGKFPETVPGARPPSHRSSPRTAKRKSQ
jgi:DNA-binding transcriptional LysR family regulator